MRKEKGRYGEMQGVGWRNGRERNGGMVEKGMEGG